MGSTLQRCQLLLKMPGVDCFQHHQYRHIIYGGRVSLLPPQSAVRTAGKPQEALGRWEGRASFHHVVEAQVDEDGLLKKKQLDIALDRMDHVCTLPIYLSLLKACIKAKSLSHAKRIHAHLALHHVDLSGPLGEHLIMTLAKCGGLDDALHLFDTLPYPTVFSWTSIMAAFTNSGHSREALQMYLCMQDEGVEPDSYTFVCLFKACGNIPDLEHGKTLHHEACQGGFASYVYVSNTLVSMYGKCTAIAEAENVFSRLSYCNVVSWNSVLSAYIDNGHGQKALLAFRQMIEEGLSPNEQSFLMALKACGTLKANLIEDQSIKSISLEIGQALHAEARKKGFASDVFVGTTLVSMYGTCGTITQAENAFSGLSLRNTVSWNAMISAYIDQDQEDSALQLYRQMQEEGVSLDLKTFLITLQACGAFADKVEALVMERQSTKVMSLEIGQALHVDASRNGFASDPFVGNTLVSMYGKCGTIVEAETVFCRLWQRSVVSWTAMLSAFVDQQQGEKAIQLYRQMWEEGPGQNWQTLMMALQACGTLADNEEANLVEGIFIKTMSLEIGQALHTESRRKGFTSYPFVGNTLVSMYGKCGTIMEAENVFLVLSQHNVVSWTAMLSAYVEQGEGEKALQLYRQMQLEMVSPDHQTFVVALQACVSLTGKGGDICLQIGRALHFDAWKRGFATHVFVGSALLRMYSRCGTIAEAENVFSGLTHRNFVSWTVMLSACIEQRQGEKALKLYRQLEKEGLSPNEQMFVMALQACAILAEKEEYSVVEGQFTKVMALEIGRALHADARRKSFTSHAFVGTTLIYMYGKSGTIVEAENVFGDLFKRSVVSWNAMLAAYVEHGHEEKALQLYTQMQEEGVNSNQQTFIAALQACRILADKEEGIFVEGGRSIKLMSLKIGHVLHADAEMKAFSLDLFVANTLVSMYGKCGLIEDAEKVFNGLYQEDIVSWNVMLSAYVEQNQAEKALKLYRQMEKELVTMDDITLMSVLQACSEAGSLESCWQLHFNVVFAEHDLNSSLASTLLYAYGSCASMVDAQAVFDRLPQPDVVSWSAYIAGYAGQENCIATFQMFEEMQLAGIKPDGVTFTSLLFACSHAGLVDTGVQYLEFMSRHYAVNLDLKHYVSILDLLGRAGDFKMVKNIFSKMPMQADLAIWLCLLGACRKHANVELGKQVFDHAVKLQPKETAPYILMSSIYTDAGLC